MLRQPQYQMRRHGDDGVLLAQLVEDRVEGSRADDRLGFGPVPPEERRARDLQGRHERGRGRHGGRGDVEGAFLDLLEEVDLLAELLGREDLDGDGAAGRLVHPVGEFLEQLAGDLGGGVGMAEAQGLRLGFAAMNTPAATTAAVMRLRTNIISSRSRFGADGSRRRCGYLMSLS